MIVMDSFFIIIYFIFIYSIVFSDSKFSAKTRLAGATKTFHDMLQTYYNDSKLLYPVLLVIRCLARSCKYTCSVNGIEFRLIIHSRVSPLLHFLKGYGGTLLCLTAVLQIVHCLLSEVCSVYTVGNVVIEVVGHWLLTADSWICFQIKLALKKFSTPVLFVQLFLPHKSL
jgi:hypothetical protein